MEGIDVEYFSGLFDPSNNEEKSELHSYISDNNENMHVIHILICFVDSKNI